MNTPMIITAIVTVVMAALFLWGKFRFGLVTMGCMLTLVVTGVLTLQEGFAGLTNNTVILIASMFAMTGALQKTNLSYKMQGLMSKLKGKNDNALMATIVVIMLIAACVLPGEVVTLLILSSIALLPEGSKVTASRVVLPLLMLGACWAFAVPVGLGATVDFMANGFMQGIVADPTKMFMLGDLFKCRIIPTIFAAVYCMLIWKKLPDHEINMDGVASGEVKKSDMPMWKQIVVYASFIVIILVMLLSSKFMPLMNWMYILPPVAVVLFGFLGIMNTHEIIMGCANDTVWMLGGILGVTTALTNTGAAAVVGNLLLPLVSWTNNGFVILLIICLFTAVMTTFLSNMGTVAVLSPLVASIAVAGGMDPRAFVACVSICSNYAFCFPSGSTTCAFMYSLGKYNPIKSLKYTAPLLVIMAIVTAASVSIFFPMY